jgi:hypothetical protein
VRSGGFDRLGDQLLEGRRAGTVPMDAHRVGDESDVYFESATA